METNPDSTEKALNQIKDSIERIDHVLKFGTTREQLGLKGSAYKRQAMMVKNLSERRESLLQVRKAYKEAFEFKGQDSQYSSLLTNWLASEVVLRWGDPNRPDAVMANAADLDEYLKVGAEKARSDPSFWNVVIVPDGLMVRALDSWQEGILTLRPIAEQYRKARDQGSSEREVQTVVEHIEFLAAMARAFRKPGDSLTAELDRCRQYLLTGTADWPDPPTSEGPTPSKPRKDQKSKTSKKPVRNRPRPRTV